MVPAEAVTLPLKPLILSPTEVAIFTASIPGMIKNNVVISSIFMGIRPAVVALIVAPVITSARSAKLNYKTFWIPVIVAALISINIGWISNPILYIILGGVGGWFWWLFIYKGQKKEHGS